MDRELALTHLRRIEAQLNEGRQRIDECRRAIVQLAEEGHDTELIEAELGDRLRHQAELESRLDVLTQYLTDMK
jgi:regulator of replication initiation timing